MQLDSIDAVKAFTDDVAPSGSWEGDMIEGFVVRSTVRSASPSAETTADPATRPPYRAGSPFFFKVKFDEPYLLYRQWREVTRAMLPLLDRDLSAEGTAEVWKKVRPKVKRTEVGLYVDWADEAMRREPELFDDYDRGIVRVREKFLEWTRGEGKDKWEQAVQGTYKRAKRIEGGAVKEGAKDKWIVVPAAVPGCGKTLIGLVLSKLFGWGHTQSDDVTAKKSAPTFLRNIAALLDKHDVVYADRWVLRSIRVAVEGQALT